MTDVQKHVHSPTSIASAPFPHNYRDSEANTLFNTDDFSDSQASSGQSHVEPTDTACGVTIAQPDLSCLVSPSTLTPSLPTHSEQLHPSDGKTGPLVCDSRLQKDAQPESDSGCVVTDTPSVISVQTPPKHTCILAHTASPAAGNQEDTNPNTCEHASQVTHVIDKIPAGNSHTLSSGVNNNEEGQCNVGPDAAAVTDSSREDYSLNTAANGDEVLSSAAVTLTASNSNGVMECGDPSTQELRNSSNDELPSDRMFCLTCHEHVRSPAAHQTHKTVQAATALTNQKNECDAFLDKSVKCASMATQWTDHMIELRDTLIKTRKSIAVEIDEMFRGIEHKLQERKMALFTQLTDFSCDKECYLDDQLKYMETVQQRFAAIANQVKQVKEDVADLDNVNSRCNKLQELSSQLDQETAKVKSFSLSKNTHLQFDRHGIQQLRRGLNSLALVSSSNVVPSRCTANGDGLHKAHINKQTVVKVTPKNCQSQVEREKGLVLQAQLYNEEVHVECQCLENSNGTYDILYIAPQAGRYKLTVKLFQQHIKGSPFSVTASHGTRVTFSKSTNAYELRRIHQQDSRLSSPSSPSSLQINRHNRAEVVSPRSVSSAESFSSLKILPSSPNGHATCSAVLPPNGDYLAVIGQYGRKKGDLSNPQGVTVDFDGRIYCADSTNQNIQVFTDTGMFIHTVGKKGRLAGCLLRPIGLCYSQDGCLIFSDYENKCVNVFKDGAFVRRIGQGKLIGPKGVTCTPSGSLIVADNKGNQVLEFSIDGRLLRKFGVSKKDKVARFAGPHYVAVSQSGDVYVSDFHNHCIKVFNKEGAFLRSFGQHGSGNGQFNAPTGLSIDCHGHIVISDWGNSRLQIFDEEGSFLAHVDTSAAPLFGPQSVHAIRDNEVLVADSGNHCVKIFRYDIL